MAMNCLYRGVDVELYGKLNGQLTPKLNTEFSRAPTYGHDEYGNCFYGNNPSNEVIEHQRGQAGIPTSGISFTPHIERARFYATRDETTNGYIYVIDQDKCSALGVTLYVVKEHVPQPSIPIDDEVILVAQEFGGLPMEIVVEILEITKKGTT
jgi:hypothetical protein